MIVSVSGGHRTTIRILQFTALILASQDLLVLAAQERPGVSARVGFSSSERRVGHLATRICTPENTFDRRLYRFAMAMSISPRSKRAAVGLVPFGLTETDATVRLGSVPGQVILGLAGGIYGTVVGGAYGATLGGSMDYRECDGYGCFVNAVIAIVGGALGVTVGEPAGLACGVHIANGSQGDIGSDIAVSGVTAVAGILTALATRKAKVLIAIPITQLVGVVVVERATAKKGNRRDVKWCH